jgi:hypothetical protein
MVTTRVIRESSDGATDLPRLGNPAVLAPSL